MHEKDEMPFIVGDYDTAQLLQDLQTTTARCAQVIETQEPKYKQLLARYNALKSSGLGEDQVAPNGHKAIADLYNLVLVDAHSHHFKISYMRGAESGGIKAAAVLKQAVTEYLTSQSNKKSCRMVIRVYANLKKLSVDVTAQYAACDLGFGNPNFPRFAAGFSCDDNFVDYVDVADDGAVERKICGLFEMHIKDSTCQNIFFGASGSPQYMHLLQKHGAFSEKITLIQRGSEDSSITKLGLRTVTLAQTFESLASTEAISENTEQTFSSFKSEQSVEYTDPMSSVGTNPHQRTFTTRAKSLSMPPPPTTPLPKHGASRAIPVNASGYRIDLHMDAPTKAQWEEYRACVAKRRPCTRFHLGQGCNFTHCEFYHGQISSNERYCLQYLMRALPCHNGGKCRDRYCVRGHMCHYKECKDRKTVYCKMPASFHGIDPRIEDRTSLDESDDDKESPQECLEDCDPTVGILIDL